MDYISRYGLDFNPFIKDTHDIIIETEEYKEIAYRLNYLLANKGFGVITGGPGRGKTTAIRNWAKQLNSSLYKVVYTSLSTRTVSEFYKHLAACLDLEVAHKKTDNFKNIQNEISRYSVEKRITPVIIIDEANYINNGILNDLKMLFNFDMDSKDRADEIKTLSKEEGLNYIKGKLAGAKSTMELFNPNALEAVINASNGIPRLINKICNSCLIIGNSKNTNIIDADIVMLAVNETELG